MTERYAVIGHPVAHSQSPAIHAHFAQATGQDIEYARIEAPLDAFERTVDEFRASGGRGLNVTLPFKQAAFRYGVGLVRDIEGNLAVPLAGKKVLLMGAGGAAQGVLGALLGAGVGGLVIANRTFAKAEALASRFKATAARYDAIREPFDIVINATSVGLGAEPAVFPGAAIGRATLAYDMVYGRETAFLQAARAKGAKCADGLGMLVEQAAESFFLWRGVRPQTRSVLASLRGR